MGKIPRTQQSILKGLSNKFVLAQLEFLSAQLHRLNKFNTMFQTTAPMLHHLREVRRLLRDILSDFIARDVVRKQDPFTISIDCMEIRIRCTWESWLHIPFMNVKMIPMPC